ncbi:MULTISPECIES: PAS domain-containing protein [unclassified Symbiopectobacterium]|uniref:PAS domain-containing protein n=1 Tax=unclassified Symbiopectobacterium TaxID=2794573 RepID=UPI002226C677|nr:MULTISPECIES: PAS domain-containing protein [unclassified Symbiopectobacterium]MCW2477213.1 PAS domain-containing protein [Candidatus Symbiopectobacterium sp. NZEC151]MCW2482517.1 PAS domain-containing protein [Candidatus Symbiopectobacterium sp. NZEC135]
MKDLKESHANPRKKIALIPPQLLFLWDSSAEPWGFKDINSRYIYGNLAYYDLLNINPDTFSIIGLLDNELPSPIADFASHFQQHDRQTIEKKDRLCSIEIHPYGKDQIMLPYYFDKYPLYDKKNTECVGTIFHARPVENSSLPGKLIFNAEPGYFLFYSPDPIFTTGELDIIFCLLQRMSSKLIARFLSLTPKTIENKIQIIYEKAGVHSSYEFINYCQKNNLDRYLPQKILKQESTVLDMLSSVCLPCRV